MFGDAYSISVGSLERRNGLDLVVKGGVNNVSVIDSRLVLGVAKICQSVLHPVFIVSLSEVVSSVSTSRLLSVFSSKHRHLCLDH